MFRESLAVLVLVVGLTLALRVLAQGSEEMQKEDTEVREILPELRTKFRKIHRSTMKTWKRKNLQSGCNIFKYKYLP